MLAGIIAGIKVVNVFLSSRQIATGTAVICAILLIIGAFSIFTGIVLFALLRQRRRER